MGKWEIREMGEWGNGRIVMKKRVQKGATVQRYNGGWVEVPFFVLGEQDTKGFKGAGVQRGRSKKNISTHHFNGGALDELPFMDRAIGCKHFNGGHTK